MTEIETNLHKFGMTVANVENGSQFIHMTFAEYFAAQRLVEILQHPNEHPIQLFEFVLQRVLVDAGFKVVRSFINASLELKVGQEDENLNGTQRHHQATETTYSLLNQAMHCIAEEGHGNLTRWIIHNYCKDETDAEQLLKPNKDGQTPVYIAAEEGEVEVVNAFVNCDKFTPAELLKPNKDGKTPVDVASGNYRDEILELLSSAGKEPKL